MGPLLLIAALSAPAAAADLREIAGLVQVRRAGSDRWRPAGRPPVELAAGDAVRTGFNARAVVDLEGGAALEAFGNTQFSIEEASRGRAAAELSFGAVRLRAGRQTGRALELRAPTSVSRARSPSSVWRVAVGGGGALAEVESGLVALEGVRGPAILLRSGERAEADLAGLHEPTMVPTPPQARRASFAGRMRRELSFEFGADAPQRLAAAELRRSEHELGRVLTDAAGERVRAEELVVRASPDSFSFVALNGRRGAGLSWYSWRGTFDRALPVDLSAVFRILPGSAGGPAPWTLDSFSATRSNGVDTLVEGAAGGHQVDVNSNADPFDDVARLYDPAVGLFVSISGAAYRAVFDRGGMYCNGALKRGWTGTNLQSQSDVVPASANDPLTGAVLASPLPVYTTNATFPDSGSARQVVYESYADGTSVVTENRALAPGGGVMTRDVFGSAASGDAWRESLLRQGFERTTTANEFNGRKIDVLSSPGFLVETGGLP